MTTPTETAQKEQRLRDIFLQMDPHQAQTIREAYYKAVEGLRVLADTLELADLDEGDDPDHPLIDEHLIACLALDAMKRSVLGRIL